MNMTQRELFIKELGPFAGPLWDCVEQVLKSTIEERMKRK